MSWVTIIWSMIASVSFTLATIYLLIWFRERRSWAYLCFFVLAVGVIGVAAGELAAMYAKSPTGYGRAIRWGHFAYGFVTVGSLGFVHFYFGTGKRWLLGAALGLRLLAVVLNFSTGLNLHISAIQSLQQVNFLGEPVSMLGVWTPNPWVRLGQLAALAQFIYVVDASLRLWRTGARESQGRAVIVGGTLAFFIVFASGQAGLVAAGVLRLPIVVSFPFLAVLLAIGYELSRDVLRAAQLGRELRESEERMALAAEAAGVGVWAWEIKRNRVWGSERWLRLFGFAPNATVTFENIIQRIHPDDREIVERGVRQSLEDRTDYKADFRLVLPEGSQRWVVARGRAHSDASGKPARMLGVAIDITDRKRAEEASRNTHELMAAVFNSVPGLLYLYAEDGQIVQWNKKHEELTGFTAEELLNRRARDWYDEEDLSTFDGAIRRIFSEGYADAEMKLIHKNGERVPYFLTGTRVMIDGKPHLVGIAIDISERKKAEQEIQQQRNELAHLSRVTMLGELAGSLAHELNQPLTAVLSNAQAAQRFLAHDHPDLNEVRDILADIVAEDKRAGEVIRRLRLLLKKGEVQHQPLNVNEVVQEVLKLVRSDLVNQGVTAQTELAPNLPVLCGDRVQLQQVLLNLVMNACDAMAGLARNRCQITIRTALAGGDSVRVSVVDSGPGIAAEKLEQVFDPFYTTKSHGMGLGLTVCRTIITAHAGKLWATSDPRRGATFHFSLPVSGKGN